MESKKKVIDNIFAYTVALDVIKESKDFELNFVVEYRWRNDWPKYKKTIQAKLNSLTKREIFELVVRTPKGVIPVWYKSDIKIDTLYDRVNWFDHWANWFNK